MNKRGKSEVSKTTNVAALVLLIMFFFIGYMVLLPSEERAELLDVEIDEETGEVIDGETETILIKSPGFLSPRGAEEQEKELDSISLYSTTEKESENLANSLYVSRNIFNNNYQEINFKLDDSSDLQNLGLFFNVLSGKGDLIIRLNENTIYQGEGASFDLPITLPLSLLRSNNKLSFIVTSPGINIFGSNYYELRDVSLIRTEKFVNTEETRRFSIDKDKLSGNVDLEFYVNCLKTGKKQGILQVELNERNIFTSRMTCNLRKNKIEIREEFFRDGENELIFGIDRGDYRVEDINLIYTFKSGENPLYYFDVDDEDVDEEFELTMLFGRGDVKRATLFINREEVSMVSEEDKWVKDISDFIVEGENYIKIIPKNEFEVTHLEIVLTE